MRQLSFTNLLPLILLAFLLSCKSSVKTVEYPLPLNYNVVWEDQSLNSSESMPLGGGDVGLNVWVEDNELLFYLSQSGTFDENNQMLKHGRVRVSMEPNPFENAISFKQELHLEDGSIVISAENEMLDIQIHLWVDVNKPVVHVEMESSVPVEVRAQYESWRTEDVVLPLGTRHACFSYTAFPGEVIKYKDSVIYKEETIQWVHRNREDKLLIDYCLAQQGLEEVRDQIHNTQKGRTFGGMMTGSAMVPDGVVEGKYISTSYTGWRLKSRTPERENHLLIALNTGQYEKLDLWEEALEETYEKAVSDAGAKERTKTWWKQFWDRSYILLNPDQMDYSDPVWQTGRNYQLFRYMLGCNAYGAYPSKFNGSLFTVDPVFVRNGQYDLDPDFRAWGGGSFTAQNQRLVYWPLLKTGDFDMMPSQFNFYRDALSSAEVRTKVYWGHEGACFTEQLENFGLPFAGGWGFESGARERLPGTEFGVQTNPYVNYHYVNQLEFSLMILDYYRFSGEDISSYMPFVKSAVRFFDEHYQYRQMRRSGQPLEKNGKLVIFPSTAAEMYKIAKNPADVIAALKVLLPRIIELPDVYVSEDEKAYFSAYIDRVPDISFDKKQGHTVIKPAESWEYVSNQEIPEMYPVFPYGIYGQFKPGLDVARNTWEFGESNEKRKFVDCWSQVGIFAARLGLVDEAAHLVVDKLEDSGRKFPAFWGPGPDWVPDVDHGGAGMINLQEMLMQTDGENIHLFPTWPSDWDVKFKLHAPYNTTVAGELKDGLLVELSVTPESRRSSVLINRKFQDQLTESVQKSEIPKAYCIDFNWGPGGKHGFAKPGLWADANPEEHVKWYKELGCNTIQTFAVSCNGYAWYKNGVVPEQPGLEQNFLTDMVKLGRENGMKVFGYFCAGANNRWEELHPDLCYQMEGMQIPYTTEYLDYLCVSIEDALLKTDMDGFMIDWLYNPGGGRDPLPPLRWMPCEQEMYSELMGAIFPGKDKITAEIELLFRRKALDRAWTRIRSTAKKAKPGCIIWLSANEVRSKEYEGSKVLKEADWIMNEAGDISRTESIKGLIGSQTRLMTCLAGWNNQDPLQVVSHATKAGIGLYGFTKPVEGNIMKPISYYFSLPVEELEKDEKNIAVFARTYNGLAIDYVSKK